MDVCTRKRAAGHCGSDHGAGGRDPDGNGCRHRPARGAGVVQSLARPVFGGLQGRARQDCAQDPSRASQWLVRVSGRPDHDRSRHRAAVRGRRKRQADGLSDTAGDCSGPVAGGFNHLRDDSRVSRRHRRRQQRPDRSAQAARPAENGSGFPSLRHRSLATAMLVAECTVFHHAGPSGHALPIPQADA